MLNKLNNTLLLLLMLGGSVAAAVLTYLFNRQRRKLATIVYEQYADRLNKEVTALEVSHVNATIISRAAFNKYAILKNKHNEVKRRLADSRGGNGKSA